jgi:hypothetical protein
MGDDMAFILDDNIWYFNQLLMNLVLLQNVGENLPLVLIQRKSFEEWYAYCFYGLWSFSSGYMLRSQNFKTQMCDTFGHKSMLDILFLF